jgi:ribonuclease BN (tRNA processing enzyme)
VVILDAGTGITALGETLSADVRRVDVLLSHLHMDHILGLGFFAGLFRPGLDVHLWGPSSATLDLRARLTRYLSPPLFPVRLRDLPCNLHVHDTPLGSFELPRLIVEADLVCHPGPTVGYRIDDGAGMLAYLSDHEPSLPSRAFPDAPEWTSGYDLATGADMLVHDAQYDEDEYADRVGWGHSTLAQTIAFATMCEVGHLVLFHHDPSHDDEWLDRSLAALVPADLPFAISIATEGLELPVTRERV